MIMSSAVIIFLLISYVVVVNGCPFIQQPTSRNISQGSAATFTVITCSGTGNVFWAVDDSVYPSVYDIDGITTNWITLSNGSIQSTLTITNTSDMTFNGAEIAVTVFIPKSTKSNLVILNIQGLLGPVTDVSYNITSNVLSWRAPPTLDGVPIHYYIITIISNISHPPSLNATTNMISLDGVDFTPCQDYIISIYPVNSVGNGTAMISPYKHVGVPMVMNDKIDVLVNDSIISVIIDYKIQYNCSDQFPDNVYATIREGNGLFNMTYYNDYITISSDSGTYDGEYIIDGLSANSNFTGQLVFTTKSGSTIHTDMFIFYTYDITDVIISDGAGVCVNVSYISGSIAKGFIITINNTLLSYNVSRGSNGQSSYCIPSLSDGYYLLRVYDWEDDGSVSDYWRIQRIINISSTITTSTITRTISTTIGTTNIISSMSSVSVGSMWPPTTTVMVSDTPPSGTSNAGVIIGIVIGCLILISFMIMAVLLIVLCYMKRNKIDHKVTLNVGNVAVDNDYTSPMRFSTLRDNQMRANEEIYHHNEDIDNNNNHEDDNDDHQEPDEWGVTGSISSRQRLIINSTNNAPDETTTSSQYQTDSSYISEKIPYDISDDREGGVFLVPSATATTAAYSANAIVMGPPIQRVTTTLENTSESGDYNRSSSDKPPLYADIQHLQPRNTTNGSSNRLVTSSRPSPSLAPVEYSELDRINVRPQPLGAEGTGSPHTDIDKGYTSTNTKTHSSDAEPPNYYSLSHQETTPDYPSSLSLTITPYNNNTRRNHTTTTTDNSRSNYTTNSYRNRDVTEL